MKKHSFLLIFFTIQFILNYSSFAGNVMYFSADGNPITKQQYDEESKKSQEKCQGTKMAEIQSRLKETDEIGRPLYKYKDGKLINPVYETSNAKVVSTSQIDDNSGNRRFFIDHAGSIGVSNSPIYDNNGNPTNDPKFIDSKGMPMYTSTGGRRVYVDMVSNKNSVNRNDTVSGSRNRGVLITIGPNDPLPSGIMSIKNNRTVWTPTSPGQSFITK